MTGIGRKPDGIDDRQLRDAVEPRDRQARLHAPSRVVANLDGDAGVGQLLDGLVGDRRHQDVDLDVAARVDPQPPALDGVLDRSGHRVNGERGCAARIPADEIAEDGRELRALGAGGYGDGQRKKANKKRSHSVGWSHYDVEPVTEA